MLRTVAKFMFNNIGNCLSIKKIADTLTSDGRSISVHTVESYLEALVESYVFNKVPRFDVKGKEYLQSGEKYILTMDIDPIADYNGIKKINVLDWLLEK